MDNLGNFCTSIRNAALVGKEKVDVVNSKMREGIAEKLKKYGYIRGYKTAESKNQSLIRIYLKYDERKHSAITAIRRVSKPSCRRYVGVDNIPDLRSGFGVTILTTSQGILSDAEAKKARLGGEVLCQIW